MMHPHEAKHLQTSLTLVQSYDGKEPFATYLKKYFALNKKHGSKDRKAISHHCYDYFRKMAAQFPLKDQISSQIDVDALINAYSKQPFLFLRIRPGKLHKVNQQLQNAKIDFITIKEDAIAIQNTTALDAIIQINKDVVIQDLNSQAFSSILTCIKKEVKTVWDVCAASGGKSILMYDVLDKPALTLTDIRASILHNAEKRLAIAKVPVIQFAVKDISQSMSFSNTFDLVFADVPCSGSGTWGRTPEQLAFFDQAQLIHYTTLQERIIANCMKAVKKGGYLIYATCSIYAAENENQVKKILQDASFELITEQYFTGYHQQADTLFGALFKKKN